MKVKDIISVLNERYGKDDDIVVIWWDSELFMSYDHDKDEEYPLSKKVWENAVNILENKKDGFGDHLNELLHDEIQNAVNIAEKEEEK